MAFLTDEKLLIVGAGGMIGSNMVQSALMLGLTPNICLYDIFEPGVHGVADEMAHCGFPGANITWTTNPEEAFTGAKYIVSSGGAPRKEGMTREDLLKGNCQIAAEFGDFIKKYCPDVKHVDVIFNSADVTALTALIHSGLKPNQLTSLAALDSTRLQQALAKEFGVQQDKVTGAKTYGGHGEQMAVFASQVMIDGKPLSEMGLSAERWAEIKHNTVQGGSNIIKLRGRSSFQSPSYCAIKMIEAAMGGEPYT
jgi:malate dehydrogenase